MLSAERSGCASQLIAPHAHAPHITRQTIIHNGIDDHTIHTHCFGIMVIPASRGRWYSGLQTGPGLMTPWGHFVTRLSVDTRNVYLISFFVQVHRSPPEGRTEGHRRSLG